ncbi:DUF7344 domain-containing protein [Halopelagius fulvigenes]|uniref:DUF7344 domain-containing protein n=1 Tax=Halopelagius fulvigenes TaxID=1198324 RepID=A0ABD5TVY3_9EURY
MDETDVSEDTLVAYFTVLGRERRRAIVKVVAEEDRPLDLVLLAGWIAGTEDVERVKKELHHLHLPELDAAGLVDYSSEEPSSDRRTERRWLTAS